MNPRWALLLSIVLTGCYNYYGPAYYGNESIYLPKPISTDTTHTSAYVLASGTVGNGFNQGERNLFGELTLCQAHTFKYVSIAYAGFAYQGIYDFGQKNDPDFYSFIKTRSRSFEGYGYRTNLDINIPFKNLDWHIIGMEYVRAREKGSYGNLVNELATYPDVRTISNQNMSTYGFYTDLTFYSKEWIGSFALKLLRVDRVYREQFFRSDDDFYQIVNVCCSVGTRQLMLFGTCEINSVKNSVEAGVVFRPFAY